VSDPGAGLCVAARAADGVIEAVEAEGGLDAPFVVGVQWHPENLEGSHRAALFGALVEAARRR
jgi:gamma-glutamyl-gamma-aminobutyrate hydrolase PuuD